MVKHIHIYRIISFFALVVFTLFPICAYSDEIQNSDGDMARQSSQDVIEKQDRDDLARVLVGVGGYILPYGWGFVDFQLAFDYRLASFYRMGVEQRVSIGCDNTRSVYRSVTYWTHQFIYYESSLFEFSQRLGVGYMYHYIEDTSEDRDNPPNFHTLGLMAGFDFDFRVTQLISLGIALDYSLAISLKSGESGAGFHAVQTVVHVGFHF